MLAELLRDTATLLPPLARDDLRAAIRGLKIAPQLEAFRGRPAADVKAAVEACLAAWNLVEQLGGSLIELDVNPLIVRPAGRGAVAVDTLITLTEA
ncbi:MAG: acetate--CoA ligase family protein [Gammaproteobacteria bacterium]|nr:acetate--CoA ligase family protein [Gammaproteobacteria bacterium]